MKTFRLIGMALVAVMFGFAMSACSDDDDEYLKELEKEYTRLIVGKWFNFTPEASVFKNYKTDGTFKVVGFDQEIGWMEDDGIWSLDGNIITERIDKIESTLEYSREIEVTNDEYTLKAGAEWGEKTHYRVKEQFDITGKYSYLNSVVRVVAKEGKTEMKLPEGIIFGGKNAISVEALHGERIVEQMKTFFADAMFTPNAKLRHTVDGTVMYKDYALNGNNLSFELNKGHQLNATSFPDEDGDRLFVIIPKQEAWVGGLADAIRKENPANVLTDEVLAALETEFMNTFETFTVVLSLSKTGEYNAAEDVDPYKDYAELIVGKWFNFTPEASIFLNLSADGIFNMIGYDNSEGAVGWRTVQGQYKLEGNKFTWSFYTDEIKIDVTEDKMIMGTPIGDKVHYRVKESFDIKGNYSYLNAAARVVPAEGKTALQLPEGVTFNGQNSISIDAMHGERIINAMKQFFADATFADGGKLNHKMDGETKEKNYTHNGNSLTFDLYEGGSYKVNATTFPDEDGDRLFIIIPKQAAWLGGMVELVEKENEGLKLNAAQIAALEKEFMDTFETFTVILSLSKK